MGRTLPPLNPLRSFEAAARHLSYTQAAEELNVTQVAVGRQVRVLEEYLEVPLFERGVRSLRLTEAGHTLLPIVTESLDRIEAGIAAINMRGRRNTLSIQVYVAFAQRWLIPRLPQFRKLHPNIEVNLRSSQLPVSFERQNLDAAIISAVVPPAEYNCTLLAERDLFPVCAPALIKDQKLPLNPEQLKKLPLLHSLARPDAWHEWLEGAGYASINSTAGLRLETSILTLGAASSSMGFAMAIKMLVEEDINAGLLVAPFAYVHRSPRKYYVVQPKDREPRAALLVFLDWLLSEVEKARNPA